MRRALRVSDNGPLWHALCESEEVIPFICAREVGDHRWDTPRSIFIRSAVSELDANLRRMGSVLVLVHGDPMKTIPFAVLAMQAEVLYVAGSADPVVQREDAKLARVLGGLGCAFVSLTDSVILGKDSLRSSAGTPYTVFTPYKKAWLSKVQYVPPSYPVEIRPLRVVPATGAHYSIFRSSPGPVSGGETAALRRLEEFRRSGIDAYGKLRDIPSADGTSRLSHHLANGTISIRTVLRAAGEARDDAGNPGSAGGADRFIGELIWREFYNQILEHFPLVRHGPFREEYAGIEWSTKTVLFDAWCQGRTGYPIVDAGMRQLNAEGWMHNRLRMVTASFLTKDLHIDWRWGERYFLDRLIDADVASNNGGWQWTAGTGTDAAPYFRVFSPVSQGRRFDPGGAYVRRYLPELANVPSPFVHAPWEMSAALSKECSFRIGRDYPLPVVDHGVERGVALSLYASVRRERGARKRLVHTAEGDVQE